MIDSAGGFLVFLLQGRFLSSSGDSNSTFTVVVLSTIAIIIVIGLAIAIIRSVIASAAARTIKIGDSPAAPRKFLKFTLERLAASYGLNPEQTKLLEFVFRNDNVTDPAEALADQTVLDQHFKQAFRTISDKSANQDEAQMRLSQLFALRNALDAVPAGADFGKIQNDMAAALNTSQDSFQVKVISVKGADLLVEAPRNAVGGIIKIPKGIRVTLSFFTKERTGFSYDSRVAGSRELPQGGEGLNLVTMGAAKPLAQRKYPRKQTAAACTFSYVFEEEGAGQGRRPRLVVDKRRFTGSVTDISVGGCALKTSTAIKVGSRLKLDIDAIGGPISCLGQVIRINRSEAMGTITNTKFLKVPRKSFNTISAMIFGYNE